MAAKYFSEEGHKSGIVSMLSGTTKNLTAGLMSNPQKMENIIGMIRTVTPLTSPQTVSKINTYLPPFEKVSTLLSMYSFLNKAQTFRPIESLNVKSSSDMVSALIKNGNFPVGKMLAQPLLANNMEKMMGAAAANMMKNGNINDILSSISKSGGKEASKDGNIDLNSLMETFMPLINDMSKNNSKDEDDEKPERSTRNSYDRNPKKEKHEEHFENIVLKNESSLEQDKQENSEDKTPYKYEEPRKELASEKETYGNNYKSKIDYDNYDNKSNREYTNDKPINDYNNKPREYNNESVNEYNHESIRREPQKPIRIRQRRHRAL